MGPVSFEPRWERPVVITINGYLPPSMNTKASGYRSNWRAASASKRRCENLLRPLLIGTDLPMDKSIRYVVADVLLTFPTHRKSRDSGNFRVVLEKALGDVLQERWLVDDSHEHFRVGVLAIAEQRGVRQTKIRLAWSR